MVLQVADITLREIALMLGRFEPPARISMDRIDIGDGKTVVILDAPAGRPFVPFAFDGKPYKRVGSATVSMPQEKYARLLLDRSHSAAVVPSCDDVHGEEADSSSARRCRPVMQSRTREDDARRRR